MLLLVLTAHAFVAGATHFHRVAAPGAQAAQAALLGSNEGGRSAPLSGDEAQCLLCRLQRNFVSELRGVTLTVAPPTAEPQVYAALTNVSARASLAMLPSGRGPPSV